nr:MAG TPA: hypothetical protein [Caudoviricetes sp.]
MNRIAYTKQTYCNYKSRGSFTSDKGRTCSA